MLAIEGWEGRRHFPSFVLTNLQTPKVGDGFILGAAVLVGVGRVVAVALAGHCRGLPVCFVVLGLERHQLPLRESAIIITLMPRSPSLPYQTDNNNHNTTTHTALPTRLVVAAMPRAGPRLFGACFRRL